jgi:hypothetical protein
MLMNELLIEECCISHKIIDIYNNLFCIPLAFLAFLRNTRKERTNERATKRSVVFVPAFLYYIEECKNRNAEEVYK